MTETGADTASRTAPEVEALHGVLAAEGAALETADGRTVLAAVAEPEEEHRRLRETVGVLDDTDRGLVRVWGARAGRVLAGLLSNDLAPLGRGRGVYSFVLTAKGRPLAELRALPGADGEEVLLDVPAACLEALLDHFGRSIPPIHARFEPRADLVRLSLAGPRAEAALRRAAPEATGSAAPGPLEVRHDLPVPGVGTATLVGREEAEGPGFDLHVRAPDLAQAWRRLCEAAAAEGGGPVGRRAWEVRRVELGIPACGRDFGTDDLAPETGQEARAISYTKGCYTGQEVVARIHYRGHVNRLLRGLAFPEDAEPPATGTELHRGDRVAATVTTAVRSPRLGTIALGYVRREVEPGERLSREPEGEPVVRVVELPFETPGTGT